MRDRIPDRNIWIVYVAIFLVGTAYGTSLAVLALFLDASHFSKQQIGGLAAWFALGIVSFSIPMGTIVRRFTARRTLIVSLAGYSVTVALFPYLHGFATIAAARFIDGAFSVGVWVSCETILLSRSNVRNKAFVMSLYAIALALGYVVGPIASKIIVAFTAMHASFVGAGVLAAIATLVVLARLEGDVQHHDAPRAPGTESAAPGLTSGEILWRIKTSCFATFAYGYFQASVVLFLPLFLIESKGISEHDTIVIPAFFAAGMLLFANIAARLGDLHGHLLLMRVLGAIGTLMILGFVFLHSFLWMCGAVFIAGATLASISPLSLALQGLIAAPADYGRSNAIYNAFYAAGMLLGPPASSLLFRKYGGAVMLDHLAGMWVVFVLFTLVFMRDDPAVQRAAERAAQGGVGPTPA